MAAIAELVSLKRLLLDMKEVLNEPLRDVAAVPMSDNIFLWHGNVRSSDGCLGGLPIHFALSFPKNYPASPPECRLFSPVPHPNVRPATQVLPGLREARWRLALFDCIPDHSTWSCAYSVQSVLVQLQAFLLNEDLQFDTSQVSQDKAVTMARDVSCSVCGHTGEQPLPTFPTRDHLPASSSPSSMHIGAGFTLPCTFTPAKQRASAHMLAAHQRQQLPGTPAVPQPAQNKPNGNVATASTAAPAAAVAPASAPGAPAPSAPVPAAPAPAAPSPAPSTPKTAASLLKLAAAPVKSTAAAVVAATDSAVKPATTPTTTPTMAIAPSPAPQAAASTSQAAASTSQAQDDETGWVQVSRKKSKHMASSSLVPQYKGWGKKGKQSKAQQGKPAAKGPVKDCAAAALLPVAAAAPPALEPPAPEPPAKALPVTKAAKKNAARAKKRKEKQATKGQEQEEQEEEEEEEPQAVTLCAPAAPVASQSAASVPATVTAAAAAPAPASTAGAVPAPPSASTPPAGPAAPPASPAPTASQEQDGSDGWSDVKVKGNKAKVSAAEATSGSITMQVLQELQELRNRDQRALIRDVYDEVAAAVGARAAAEAGAPPPSSLMQSLAPPVVRGSMGLLGLLPRDVLLQVMSGLQRQDVVRLSQCSRGLSMACKDGQLWLTLLQRHFPGSRLPGAAMSDWRQAFMLEAASAPGELHCFYSRTPFTSDVLGLPLRYTINPVTQVLDYIEVEPDLMSVTLFAGGINKTVSGERVDAVLPVYLNADHFERALPHLHKLLKKLAPSCRSGQVPGGASNPEVWLELLANMMNTAAVLLSDRGVAASQRALTTYCMLHRLLLALCERYSLWSTVSNRLNHFLAHPNNRVKAVYPNLGHIYPLLSLSPAHEWSRLGPALVNESFHRAVLWMCKNDTELIPKFKGQAAAVDPDFLSRALKASEVTRRLMMFNVAFLRLVACPPGSSLEQVMDSYDVLLGRPGAGLVARFQRHVQRILAADSWQEFFTLACLRCPADPQLQFMLQRCWKESLAKKYHSKDTDFSAIQRSGVSKILLKGESYTAPPGLKVIEMEERWRWRPEAGTRYLDASCLLFDSKGQLLEAVDYSHTRSGCTQRPGAVLHSGDILADGGGLHTIRIDLGGLGPKVSHMYITMSSWAMATLDEIEQPFVQVSDPQTQMDLCTYHLEDVPLQVRSRHSSVIMCKVCRNPAVAGQWKIQAIGQLGQGQAGSYEAMLQVIRGLSGS